MPPLRLLLDDLGRLGLRLFLLEGRLTADRPDTLPADALAPLRANPAAARAAVVAMDEDLAEALQILDALVARPETSPALRRVIDIRRAVYAEWRERLAAYDLAADARAFAARVINPPAPDHVTLATVARQLERAAAGTEAA